MEIIYEVDENKENIIEPCKKTLQPVTKTFGVQGQSSPSLKNPSVKTRPAFTIYEDCKLSKNFEPSLIELKITTKTDLTEGLEYFEDNYVYLKELESKHRPRPDFLSHQPYIDEGMRAVLINWMVLASAKFQLQPETLHLAVSYVDRFLSKLGLVKEKFQLLGTVSLLIATKVEEFQALWLRKFVDMTAGAYTKAEALKTEGLVLRVLTFDLNMPTSIHFLKIFCCQSEESVMAKYLAMYICELGLLVPNSFLPSCLAASAIVIARHTLDTRVEQVWPQCLEDFSGYKLKDLKPCVKMLEQLFKSDLKLREIKNKYASRRFLRVSHIFPRKDDVFG